MPRKPATFVSLPAGVFCDGRLRAQDLRVLGVLRSFCPRGAGPFSLDRKAIADAIAAHETAVSRATRRIEEAGWIERVKIGRRGGSTLYQFTWEQEKGNNGVTLKGADRVTSLSPYSRKQGNNGVTLSRAERVTQVSPNRERVTTLSPFPVVRVTSLSPFPGAQRARISNIKNNTDTDTDLGSVTPESNPATSSFSSALELLFSHGMPEAFIHAKSWSRDRDVIQAWLNDGFSLDEIAEACRTAADRKSDGKPIGPRYVDSCLRNNKNQGGRSGRKAEDFGGTDYQAGAW